MRKNGFQQFIHFIKVKTSFNHINKTDCNAFKKKTRNIPFSTYVFSDPGSSRCNRHRYILKDRLDITKY